MGDTIIFFILHVKLLIVIMNHNSEGGLIKRSKYITDRILGFDF